MADSVKSSATAQFEFAFVDGDTRTFNLPNPKANIQASEVQDLNAYIRENNLIVGDKEGGTFAQINKIKKIGKTTTTVDLNPD